MLTLASSYKIKIVPFRAHILKGFVFSTHLFFCLNIFEYKYFFIVVPNFKYYQEIGGVGRLMWLKLREWTVTEEKTTTTVFYGRLHSFN